MKKAEFLDELCRGLRFHSDPEEIMKVVSFYDQAIEDRMEDGMSEEEAVDAVGSIDDIIREVKGTWEQGPSPAGASKREEPGQVTRQFDPAVCDKFEIFDSSGDVYIAPSPDGLVHFEYTVSEAWRYEISEGPTVTVRRVQNADAGEKSDIEFFGMRFKLPKINLNGLFSEVMELRVLVPEDKAVSVSINAASGDVHAEGAKVKSLSVKLASGDVELRDTAAEVKMSLLTASGDIDIKNAETPELTVGTASGDVEADSVSCGSLAVRTASGDITLEETRAAGKLSLTSVSGDIDVSLTSPCRAVSADSVSGDVTLELSGGAELYTVVTRTNTGDVSVDGEASFGENSVKVKTLSGDIDVKFQ